MIQPLLGAATVSSQQAFARDVVAGLRKRRKSLPSKYLYDHRGSQLFETICTLDEYYPTRVEIDIMRRHAKDMASFCGPRCSLIEFGSGAGVKTRLLLDALSSPVAYFPIEISPTALYPSADAIAETYSGLEVHPICDDFTRAREAPKPSRGAHKSVIYFPGSTIGNFRPREAIALLENAARLCRDGAGWRRPGLLLGVDLRKDRHVLEAAYDDRRGVTAEFNLNVLRRINHELDADFDLDAFEHRALWNDAHSRIEMHLVSTTQQAVRVADREFKFAAGESICTELSYKYTPERIAALADRAGFAMNRRWIDDRSYFMVAYFTLR